MLARFRRVKSDDLTIATRQLSTMVSSGMSLLRALYVIEEQTENDMLARSSSRSARTSRPASRCPRRSSATRTSSTTCTWRWSRAGETGGILDQTLIRVADQLEKDAALRRQVKAAMVYPC